MAGNEKKKKADAYGGNGGMLEYYFHSVYLDCERQHGGNNPRRTRQETYGIWTGAMYNATEEQTEALAGCPEIEQLGKMYIYGRILDSDNKEIGGIGAVDEAAMRLGKLRVKEGRFPKREDEIAMEEKLLKRLGISYENGREVSLNAAEGKKQTFRLCGVIEDYSGKWQKEDFYLASAIVMEQGTPEETHLFFYGGKYEKLTEMEELEGLKQPYDGSKLVRNKMSYDTNSIGVEEALQSGILTTFLGVVSVCIIFYIELMQFQQRRNSLVTMRGIGASKDQLLSLLLWENVYLLKYALPIGVACGIALPCLLLKILNFRILLRWSTIIYSIIITLAALLTGTLLMYSSIRKLQVMASFRAESSVGKKRKFPRIKKVSEMTTWKIFLRRRRFAGKQTWIRNGVLLFGALLVVTASTGAAIGFESYQNTRRSKDADYEWWGQKYGIYLEDIQAVKDTEGIREVRICLGNRGTDGWDNHRRVSWNGFKDSDYLREQNLIVRDWIDVENIEILEDFKGEMGKIFMQ